MSEECLLAIDVGNTNVVLGIFRDGKLIQVDRFETPSAKKKPVLKKIFERFLSRVKIKKDALDGLVFSNVVPSLRKNFFETSRHFFCKKFLEVTAKSAKIHVRVDFPKEVGADRLCNAVAAWEKFHRATIVVDFGTAITLDIITAKGEYGGGAIVPGILSQAKALSQFCAKLFEVKPMKPKHVVGRNTKECIQTGIYYGSIGSIDHLIERSMKEEGSKMKVVATGGFSSLVAKESKWIEKVEPNLTLEGLYYIWKRNFR